MSVSLKEENLFSEQTFFEPFDDSDYARIQKAGADRNVTVTGSYINTSEVDRFRQGIELSSQKYRAAGFGAKVWAGNTEGYTLVHTIGQPVSFTEFYGRKTFNDEQLKFDPAVYVQTSRDAYPKPINFNDGPQQNEEASIEPLTIPYKKGLRTNEGPEFAHSVRGTLEDGNSRFDRILGGPSSRIQQLIDYGSPDSPSPFLDEGTEYHGTYATTGSVMAEGFITSEARIIKPYDDAGDEHLQRTLNSGSIAAFGSAVDALNFNLDLDVREDRNKRSSGAGRSVYGPGMGRYGTDSIAYWGMIKGSGLFVPSSALSFSGGPLVEFADGNFTNASPRFLLDPITPQVVDEVAGATLATVTIDSKKYAQIEEARTNIATESQDFNDNDWTLIRATISADAANSPAGNATADKLVTNTDNNTHVIRGSVSVDGSSTYTLSVYAKASGYNGVRLHWNDNVANTLAIFDLNTGTIDTDPGSGNAFIQSVGDDWYLVGIRTTSDGSGASNFYITVCNDSMDASFAGDGSGGTLLWNAQVEVGHFPSSAVHTEAASTTRAKDQLYWNDTDVPAVMYGGAGKWAIKVIPFFAHDESGSSYNMIAAAGSSDYFDFNASSKRFELLDGGVRRNSNALTFARYTPMTIIIDNDDNSIEVIGADSGDGKTFGSAYAWSTSADFRFGMYSSGNQYQFNGLISEPYTP